MIKSALKQITRHIRRNKLFSFINIFGLGIGLGCTLLMGIYILHEFSFDKYHKNSQNLYRIITDEIASSPYPMGDAIKENVPGIKDVFRIYDIWNVKVRLNENFITEDDFILADQKIFSILDIPLLLGQKNKLFETNSTLVVSDIISNKYFPNENPIGKTLEVGISGRIVHFTITGVFRHFPSYSSLQANWIGNIEEAFPVMSNISDPFQKIPEKELNQLKQNWGKTGFQTIALTTNNPDIKEAENLITSIYQNHSKKDHKITLQPFVKMYLHSENISNLKPFSTSQLSTLRIYAGIATLILLIACINYILLSLADAKKHLKQVAFQKINGASSFHIQKQYILQSLFTSFLSLIPALLFLLLIIPFFNQLFDKNLSIELFLEAPYLIMLFAFVVFTGLIAGSYISFYYSRLNPLQILSPGTNKLKSKSLEKSVLVIAQFVIFILLSSSTFIMEKQMSFLSNKNQGFDTDNLVVFRLDNKDAQRQSSAIISRIKQNSHVKMIAESVLTPPAQDFWQFTISNTEEEKIDEEALYIGANLISTLQIPIIVGKDFSESDNQNNERKVIINEAAANKYKLKAGEYYGKTFIKAVVANFHAHSLHKSIKPLLLFYSNSDNITELVVRTDGNNAEVIEYVRSLWAEILPTSF
ncbi:MAG TPA: ABC transporter permease, partial [Draconibacterium sp.]|nr:ABC transporter permease [Draconibacterium sp.]